MFKNIIERYKEPKTVIRACAHMLLGSNVFIFWFFIKALSFPILSFTYPIVIELLQLIKDGELELFDRCFDILEHYLGIILGILIVILAVLTKFALYKIGQY